jgi:hypothetical protein
MALARATVELGVNPNNLTNQLMTILRESFGIEPKDRGRISQNYTLTTTTNSPTLEAIESLSFLSLVGRMVKPH